MSITKERLQAIQDLVWLSIPSDGRINRHMHVHVPIEDMMALLEEIHSLREALGASKAGQP